MIHFKESKSKSALSTRWAQMSKQEQIIEKKKMEIQAKLEAQKNAAALAAQAKLTNPAPSEEAGSQNIFSNDGSFMTQYKALLDKQNKEKQEKEEKEKQDKQEKTEETQKKKLEAKHKTEPQAQEEDYDVESNYQNDRRLERQDSRHRDRSRRWSDRSRNRTHSPFTPTVDERKTNHIPSLMQLSVMPPDDESSPNANCKWNSRDDSDSNDDYERKPKQEFDNFGSDSGQVAPESVGLGPSGSDFIPMGHAPMGLGPMGFSPMGPGPMGHGPMVPGSMRPVPMGLGPMGPGPMGPGPMGPGRMAPGPMGPGPMGPGPMGPGPMGPGTMGPGPMGPGPMGSGPMGPGPMGPGSMGPGPMGPGPMGPGPMGPGPMGPGPMGHAPIGPGSMRPGLMGSGHLGPMGPGPMGPGPLGSNPMPPGTMGPVTSMNSGAIGSGTNTPKTRQNIGSGNLNEPPNTPNMPSNTSNMPPNMGPGKSNMPPNIGPGNSNMPQNMGPGNSNMPQNTGPGNSNMPQNMGSGNSNMPKNMGPGNSNMSKNMGPGNSNMPPLPFMGGPPNFPIPTNFGGPNVPGGPCRPVSMPPNICGPNLRGSGPNGPMPQFFPPNGPPNSMMPANTTNDSRFLGPHPPFGPNGPNFGPNRPNFGPNGPNFGPNGPNFGPNGPNFRPNIPFMPPNSMPLPPNVNEPKSLDAAIKHPPLPPMLSKDSEARNIPPLPNKKVLSADTFQSSVHRAAAEVASNGDHWENVLKAMNPQDRSMWFLHNTNSNEYKMYREILHKIRNDCHSARRDEIKPEDKYDPEFSLEDDDSNDERKPNKGDMHSNFYSNYQDNPFHYNSGMKRDVSSPSDEEGDNKRERRKKRKSRWGDDPPVDIKPPGIASGPPGMPTGPPGMPSLPPGMPSLPPGMPSGLPGMVSGPPPPLPGAHLSKIDGDGIKLTTINRNNQALMQYAMTNYGTTNLSPEDWQKCEDNFKLNLLFQDMLKKRQEVERLAAAGRHKYEYDSDEDTMEGTWEHKLRAKEMNATEKWADELTKQAAGKHHIGDFLPPEELKKFMEKYSAVKSGKEPDLSDYKEYKLREDNLGFKMLQKLGWNEGEGLGMEGTGIIEPINKSNQPVANMGLGAKTADVVSSEDDEFDAYRKRMMLAYRFRPNPLNNPRRPYY